VKVATLKANQFPTREFRLAVLLTPNMLKKAAGQSRLHDSASAALVDVDVAVQFLRRGRCKC